MSAILFHGNNLPTSITDSFRADKYAIDYTQNAQNPNFVLDRFIHDSLDKALQNKFYDIIFIPYTLSQHNYLELTGLRVAIHIRVTKEFKHACVPIVFIGPESSTQIAKLTELGNILFTPGVFYTAKTDSEYLKKLCEWIKEQKPKITEAEWEKCLRRLQLSPPANYDSHHSIDNELALLRWSECIGCVDQIAEVKENIQKNLYFKYQRTLNPIKPINQVKYSIQGKAKILLIDDEAEKGWKDFYTHFFSDSPKIEFDYLKLNFKTLSQDDISERAKNEVEKSHADIVLLDLRLCDTDFESELKPENLTGYKILKEIKKINKGIQIIIISASNKVWNYQSLHSIGANGYIIKRGNSDVIEDIKNLKQVIEKAIERANYLKDAFQKIKSLSYSINDSISNDKIDKKFGEELIKFLELSFRMYENSQTREEFAFAYLALFKSLELISNNYVINDSGTWRVVGNHPLKQYKWDKQTNTYKETNPPNFKNNIPTTFEKIAGLCLQLWNYDHEFVEQLYYSIKCRNEFIHPSDESECEKIYIPKGYLYLLDQIVKLGNKITT
ncbi:MAG TPA: response regulator [Bacteroidales bacterium]|nr:response regulator [Bacteroidales bacterium]